MNTDRNIQELLIETLIDKAGKDAAELMGRHYSELEYQHIFSKRHEDNMQKIFRKERRKLLIKDIVEYSQRAAIFVLVIVALSGAAIFSVQACRVQFLNFIIDITQTDADIDFDGVDADGDSYHNDNITLDYIPEGFKLESSETAGDQLFLIFVKDEQNFRLTSSSIQGNFSVDTENANIKKLAVNGYEAFYSTNINANILVWHDDNYAYSLSGNLEESELVKIAEKIKK